MWMIIEKSFSRISAHSLRWMSRISVVSEPYQSPVNKCSAADECTQNPPYSLKALGDGVYSLYSFTNTIY